jgi:hypothetical protein
MNFDRIASGLADALALTFSQPVAPRSKYATLPVNRGKRAEWDPYAMR